MQTENLPTAKHSGEASQTKKQTRKQRYYKVKSWPSKPRWTYSELNGKKSEQYKRKSTTSKTRSAKSKTPYPTQTKDKIKLTTN